MTSRHSEPFNSDDHVWWCRPRPYSKVEIISDAIVHCIGIGLAAIVGGVIVFAGFKTAPTYAFATLIYVSSLVTLLSVSLAFNMAPITPIKRFLARLDQAAIFLLIAGTYTPVLTALSGTSTGELMLALVWGASLIGVALKLFVPHHFGRLALFLYAGIGWSGIAVFNSLAQTLPANTLWLLLAGGIAYTAGIIFHVHEKLHFHNVLWHCFVVLGASLHLWAIFEWMVLRRL
jgi:hemolysin III